LIAGYLNGRHCCAVTDQAATAGLERNSHADRQSGSRRLVDYCWIANLQCAAWPAKLPGGLSFVIPDNSGTSGKGFHLDRLLDRQTDGLRSAEAMIGSRLKIQINNEIIYIMTGLVVVMTEEQYVVKPSSEP